MNDDYPQRLRDNRGEPHDTDDRWTPGRFNDDGDFFDSTGKPAFAPGSLPSSWVDLEQRPGRRTDRHGPHAGKGPKGYTRSKEVIREEVCDRLEDDPLVDASEIEVSVDKGEVLLSGKVADRGQKRQAERCTEAVRGVRDVHNHLRLS